MASSTRKTVASGGGLVIGILIGVAIGAAMGNIAMGIGIGIAIGIAMGLGGNAVTKTRPGKDDQA